ncbi:MAG: hypothetical protein QXH08_00300 [Candidatus Hadarchaeales archaeon]
MSETKTREMEKSGIEEREAATPSSSASPEGLEERDNGDSRLLGSLTPSMVFPEAYKRPLPAPSEIPRSLLRLMRERWAGKEMAPRNAAHYNVSVHALEGEEDGYLLVVSGRYKLSLGSWDFNRRFYVNLGRGEVHRIHERRRGGDPSCSRP